MAIVPEKRKRPTPPLQFTYWPPRDGCRFGVLSLQRTDKDRTGYYLWSLPSDFGHAYRVEHFSIHGGGHYDVLLDPDGRGGSCECQGFLRWDHCRHVEALLRLQREGKL